MDDSLYDEFGNYIGPDIESDLESDRDEDDEELPDKANDEEDASDEENAPNGWMTTADDVDIDNQIVLAEDKKYYPTAEEVYGEEVETLVMDEDEQPLEQPIIKPVRNIKFEVGVEDSSTYVSTPFLLGLMSNPSLVRNVTLVGHLHHGKTLFMDMLVEQTHHIATFDQNSEKHMRYTDTRVDEQERRISIKTVPMTLVLEDSNSKSFLCNIMDTPGHSNFSDEMTAALRLADGAVLIVDAAEGVMVNTERAIRHAIQDRLPIVVVINKVDRLITELKLPPKDAYHKIRHTIEAINNHISAASSTAGNVQLIDPVAGNVCFASASAGWSFTLQSFAKLYVKLHGIPFDAEKFASRLWGDYYFDADARVFRKKQPANGVERSFVQFVLEPLYKIYSQVIGEHKKSVEATLAELGVTLSNAAYRLNVRPLLRLACSSVFGSATGFTDMLVHHIPSAREAASRKVEHIYTGPKDTDIYRAMVDCNPNGPLMVNITKLYPKSDCSVFDAFGRVYSGEIQTGQTVRVLGEGYSPDDEEDMTEKEVTKLWVYQARYRIPVSKAPPGSWVLIEGVDASIMKTASLCNVDYDDDVYIFRPLQFNTLPVVKTATEPLNPSELPKMVEGLRKISKSYPLAITKVEESGEHTILGTGELYLDSIMKDLRELYSEVEVKVADPVVSFCETVVDSSSLKCYAETPNKKNKITMIAESLEKGLAEDIENGVVSLDWPQEFAVVYGFMPAKATIFNRKCNPILELGTGPYNTVRWNPKGKFLCLAGFGNLPGDMAFWDYSEKKLIGAAKAEWSVTCEWSPDGRYLLNATTAPRLQVDNRMKVFHHNGKLIFKKNFAKLYQAEWKPESADKFGGIAELVTSLGSLKVEENKPQGSKSSQASAKTTTVKAPSIHKPAAYRPPHAKAADAVQDQLLGRSSTPEMSKNALRNKKKREKQREKKAAEGSGDT